MQTVQPASRDPVLEAHAFWHKFQKQIAITVVVLLLLLLGLGGYKLYSDRQNSAAAAQLAAANSTHGYEQVIADYPNTPAAASAYLFLADIQRNKRMFVESNATLQSFLDKNPKHELASTAAMANAANLESMGKTDEALARYRQVAANYPQDFNAPAALISEVRLLKAKNQPDQVRQICENILTQYRDSFWAGEAMRELRSLQPSGSPAPAAAVSRPPGPGPMMLPTAPTTALPPGGPAPAGAPTANPSPKPR